MMHNNTNNVFILFDNSSAINTFKNKHDALHALIMLAKLRNEYVKHLGYTELQNNNGYRLEEFCFSSDGLCFTHNLYKCNATDCQITMTNIVQTNSSVKIVTNKIIAQEEENSNKLHDYETMLDKNIEQLERELDKAHNIENTKNIPNESNDKLSIFCSNKVTYMKIKNKINTGVLKNENIPVLFSDKFLLYKFMEENKLLSIDSNKNAHDEYETYCQLYKIIEANDSTLKHDPLDNIDIKYADICFKFLEYLDDNGGIPQSEKQLQTVINANCTHGIFDCDESS